LDSGFIFGQAFFEFFGFESLALFTPKKKKKKTNLKFFKFQFFSKRICCHNIKIHPKKTHTHTHQLDCNNVWPATTLSKKIDFQFAQCK